MCALTIELHTLPIQNYSWRTGPLTTLHFYSHHIYFYSHPSTSIHFYRHHIYFYSHPSTFVHFYPFCTRLYSIQLHTLPLFIFIQFYTFSKWIMQFWHLLFSSQPHKIITSYMNSYAFFYRILCFFIQPHRLVTSYKCINLYDSVESVCDCILKCKIVCVIVY